VGGESLYRPDQVRVGVRLEEITSRARLQEILNERLVVMHSEDENLGTR
jgi:hypothetical protein